MQQSTVQIQSFRIKEIRIQGDRIEFLAISNMISAHLHDGDELMQFDQPGNEEFKCDENSNPIIGTVIPPFIRVGTSLSILSTVPLKSTILHFSNNPLLK